MDRNFPQPELAPLGDVALLAEGVDRNFCSYGRNRPAGKSPSSRRAWIEIQAAQNNYLLNQVALLAEGVDRNRLEHRGFLF